MSEHHVVEIELDDEEALVQALEEMGYKVEVHANGASVQGYGSSRWGTAHVICRKQANRLSADFGFERVGATYKLHLDSMDRRRLDQKRLTQLHAKHKVANAVKKSPSKYKLASQDVDSNGNIRMKIKVRTY